MHVVPLVLAGLFVCGACEKSRTPQEIERDNATAALVQSLTASWNAHSGRHTGPDLCLARDVDKRCKTDADCEIVDVILDECRTTAQIGVSAGAKRALEARLVDPCANKQCALCNVRWIFTEDCGHGERASVACTSGRCVTRSVAR